MMGETEGAPTFYRIRLECLRNKIPMARYMAEYQDKERFLGYCKACKRFRHQWVCPPFDYDVDEVLKQYDWMEVIGVKAIMEEKLRHAPVDDETQYTFSYKVMNKVRLVTDPLLIRRENNDVRAFYAGSCQLCPDGFCTRPMDRPCRFPALARPSLESFGFDISKTTEKLLGIPLLWSKDHVLPPYFSLVSGLMMKEKPRLAPEEFTPEEEITLYV